MTGSHPFMTGLCLRRIDLPEGMTSQAWAVIRLESLTIEATAHDELTAVEMAGNLSRKVYDRHIACPLVTDPDGTSYVEVLV